MLLFDLQISAEEMQELSPVLSKSVSIMIEKAPSLFAVPRELGDDVANFWREMEDPNVDVFTTDKENLDDHANIQKAKVNNHLSSHTILHHDTRCHLTF